MKKVWIALKFSDTWKKGIVIMSNFLIVLLFFNLTVSASVLGQKVSLVVEDASLKDCLNIIEKQVDLGFFFNTRTAKQVKGIHVNMENAPLELVLDRILENTGLRYEIDNTVILIIKMNEPPVIPALPGNKPSELVIQQKIRVTGKVTDENQEPLIGATIFEKGTTNGVVTDNDGAFSIDVENRQSVLVISFVGYEAQELSVGNNISFRINLTPIMNLLDEAVVVGYGTRKMKDLTGSVVRINARAIETSSFTDMGRILQGQVAGMEVIAGDGRPGDQVRIRIRGESSLQGDASPLIVIDDIPMPDNYDINLINPSDIENIDILKGASAAAIYGSKGAAGVVMITTKQGRLGGFEVFYNGRVSTQVYFSDMTGLNADEFKQLIATQVVNAHLNSWATNPIANRDIRTSSNWDRVARPGYFGDADTDWVDAMTQQPMNTDHTIGIRGGSRQASYYSSFGYTETKGLIIGNESRRLTVNLNMDLRPNKWLEMGFRMNAASNPVRRSLQGGDWGVSDMLQVFSMRPDIPVYNDDGSYHRFYSTGHRRYLDNPVQMAREAPQLSTNLTFSANGYSRIVFTENLRYQLTYSYSQTQGESKLFYGSYTYSGSGGYYRGVDGLLNISRSYSDQTNIDNALYYTKTTANHDISLMAGTTFNQDHAGSLRQQYQDFPDDYIQNTIYNAAKWNNSSGSDDASAYFSVYGRANYKFMDRYLVTGTLRRDASSKFAPAYRNTIFPSLALAWILSEENFLIAQPLSLSFLKLRIGWGVTGNDRIGRYAWRALFSSTDYFDQPGTIPSTVGNEQIRWEETTMLDIGIDFGFWQNRIFGTLGWYAKDTDGMLFGYQLAPSAGLRSTNMNIAQILNKGIEYDIRAQIIETRDLSLSLSFNVASNRGKVQGLNQEMVANTSGGSIASGTTSILKEGEPIGLIYGYRYDGIHKELDGTYAWGRIKYKDLNGDGVLNADDREIIGKTQPDFFGGFRTDFRYKRVTARLTGKYSYGAQKHWTGIQDRFHSNLVNPQSQMYYAFYAWTPDNPDSPFQRYGSGWESSRFSDNLLFDASFLQFSDLNIGYDLPDKWVNRIGLSTANVYASANNLLTLTRYPGTNVESFSTSSIEGTAQDRSVYPLSRTFTLGLRFMIR
jgi:TonB-dependent starch-binding outer membrane protein SusC